MHVAYLIKSRSSYKTNAMVRFDIICEPY